MALGRAITFLARKEFDERISVTLEEGIVFGKNSDVCRLHEFHFYYLR